MKTLILTDDFPPQSFGGADRVAFNLARGLQKTGQQVFIITTCREKSQQENIDYQGLKLFRIYANYHERWRAYLSLYNPQTVRKVNELIKEIKPDVVHAHNIHHYLSYYSLKIAKKYSKAVFLTTHDMMLVHYGKWTPKHPQDYKITIWQQIHSARKRYNPFRNIIIRYFLRYVDKIFAVSDSLKKFLKINDIKNIETVHNGIDVESWRINPKTIGNFKEKYDLVNKKVILFGGRLSGAKGGERIILAMKEIVKEIPETILLVLGKSNNQTQVMLKLAQKLGIKNNIIFTDWLSGDELKAAYYSADIVVIPSIYFDPFPTLNLEAMACKKPVIGTKFGGTPEAVQDGVTGFIVNPFNVGVMAEKIIGLLKNPDKARQMGEAGYQRLKEHFNLDDYVNQTIGFYKKYL